MMSKSTVAVTLSWQEMHMAAMVGVRRQLSSMLRQSRDRNGAEQMDPWSIHVHGAMGECAVAKYLGLYWPGSIDARKAEPDLPPDWQVRTRAQHDYDLIVRDDDADDQRFVLVTGSGPTFMVRGYLHGRDAKRPEWKRDRGDRSRPCYWVPQAALRLDFQEQPMAQEASY